MATQNATDYFQKIAEYLIDTHVTTLKGQRLSLDEGMQQAVSLILSAGAAGKIMVIGNGGSAAIASHAHNDLCKSVGVKALVLTETALLTALTNDLSYAEAYERQVQLWATSDDLLMAISSSGQSENILRAVRAAVANKCKVITFSGFAPDNPLRHMGAINFYIASNQYGIVEVSHAAHFQYLTDTASVMRAVTPLLDLSSG
jgi:D-sedoheptulose 7-phosphate isomerase